MQRGDSRVESINMGHFTIDVVNAIAHIDGHVHSKKELQAVEELVLGIEGIKSLSCKLNVRQYRNYPREH